ncbi:MAG: hypothetical protein CL824_01820 [Crocinitomicaceae bacterium]|nr:hypothetical protein [Crocinitomicaceae bacterium]|tara:strand:- start:744 stop:1295 length:552 start_codon:yes stop_codon:yes gene_type:complete
MKKLFFFSLTIIFISFGCADINRSKQIKNIDTMIEYLDSTSTIIHSFKPDSLSRMANNSTNVEIRIKNYLINDTIDLELGKKMDAYKIMRRSIGVLRKNHSKIKALVKEESITLNQLKTDINNGSGRREKYDEYIAYEQNKCKQIKIVFDEFIKTKKAVYTTYNRYHKELNEFSLSLIKKEEN